MMAFIELFIGGIAIVCTSFLTRILMLSRIRVMQAKLEQSLQENLLRKEEANQRLKDAHGEIERLHAELKEAARSQAMYQAKAESAEQSLHDKIKLLTEAREALMQSFQAVSSEVLHANNQAFLTLAEQKLSQFQAKTEVDWEQRAHSLMELAGPLQERLQLLDQQIQSLEKARVGAYHGLQEQVRQLVESQTKLCDQTLQLGRALKNPQARGQWGEIQLKRVVEIAGMLERVDFYTQETFSTQAKTIRPDMRVALPAGRCVFVDAKAPLSAYLEANEILPSPEAKEKLRLHAKQLKDHISALSAKEYWRSLDPSPEFVILFLPAESFLSAALQEDPTLMEYGVKAGVFIATPISLISLLKSIAYGWSQVSLAQEAKSIVDLGRELYDRLTVWAGHFCDLRKSLDSTVKCYNKSLASFESRVLPSARRLKNLGIRADQDMIFPKYVDAPDSKLIAKVDDLPSSID